MRSPIAVLLAAAGTAILAFSCQSLSGAGAQAGGDLGTAAHRDAVMSSRFCADCHPAIYAEHRQNTHGRAFFDEEARLATRGFRREDCIRCHTPRPVFETGIGMTPMQRWTNLEEGNTCMSCHGRTGYDYGRFVGGAECRSAFEPEVGTVAHCATCHRIAGTPDQWSRAEHGNLAGRLCIDCHMPLVTRPVATGQPPRPVRSHVFPASSSESQLRRAYAYDAHIEGNVVVVAITNKGVGHNFPTANRQRGVESLVVVRDEQGNEVARSRLICRYPYASELEPHQLTLPRGSQIPSGKTTEHRVPLGVASGTVECRLFFKLYRPSADTDAHLSRCLEDRRLPFAGVAPSNEPVLAETEVDYPAAATSLNDFLSPAGFANVARPPATVDAIVVPAGANADELQKLGAMLEAHLPEVRKQARERLAATFPASAEVLVQALGRWSNETFNEAQRTFLAIGSACVPTLRAALASEQLYIRCHARDLLAQLDLRAERDAVLALLRGALAMDNPLDRRSAAQALGELRDDAAVPLLRAHLDDGDQDVVHAAARSLAQLGDRDAVPAMTAALARARWPETHRALAPALAALGSAAGVQPLIDDLDNADELQREYAFTSLFAITGRHFGYEPSAPAAERLKAASRLQSWWTEEGRDGLVHAEHAVDATTRAATWALVEHLGGGTDTVPGGDDAQIESDLLAFGRDAVPALLEGLTFPPGFADKRARCCQLLGRIGSKEAAPFLAAALRDPVPAVTEWACWALESCGDEDSPAQLRSYQDRVPALVGADRGAGEGAPADRLLARAARTRLVLGDERARTELIGLLLSQNDDARQLAIGALRDHYGEDRDYRADATPAERAAAVQRWLAK
ncbi:MAG TPA: HEAT repeat domain-containing protein [Planctomycetota bacterium]|nr:HEAT repeat domain-containing protein [Planctomycetota bacterium]